MHNIRDNSEGRKRKASSSLAPPQLRGSKDIDVNDDEMAKQGDASLCWFCQEERAVIGVRVPHPRFPRRKKIVRPLCLKHYYTTPAARTNSSSVSADNENKNNDTAENEIILDREEMEQQLRPMQSLFAEAFVQLQQELSEEAARAFDAQQRDPLAILHKLHRPSPKNNSSRLSSNHNNNQKEGAVNAGGFLRRVPLPERLLQTQQKQAQIQRDLTQRMETAATATKTLPSSSSEHRYWPSTKQDFSKRRKSSRKSIWNQVLLDKGDFDVDVVVGNETVKLPAGLQQDPNWATATCSCGSDCVTNMGTNTSRIIRDLKIGETWGTTKDRGDEVLTRLQCQACGRTWAEELS